jgi:putative radical SAM enzyme (TIGR03279 family)
MGRRTRSKPSGGVVAIIEPGSIAARLGLQVGDRLYAINGKVLRDLIDYRYEVTEEYLRLKVLRDERTLFFDVEKDMDTDLGLSFEMAVFDNIIECHNRCSFCFIHQMAKGLRHSLYIMDDDYRLSFLQGNFVTLTNMTPYDWKRVKQDRISPINVSVHTTNPELREAMVKNPKAKLIKKELKRLQTHRIDFNAQIVYCPDFNDGAELDRTLRDLEQFIPNLLSIAIVPVGMTQFRKYLPQLTPVSKENARKAIEQVHRWQKHFFETDGDPMVCLGEEFYLIADKPIPVNKHYGDYEQLGDGVGGAALMSHEFKKLAKHLPTELPNSRRVTVVTGLAGERIMTPLVEQLNQIKNLEVNLKVLKSDFWGGIITVTGLLTHSDLVQHLKDEDLGDALVISRVMLKDGTNLLLDGKTTTDVSNDLNIPVVAVENSAYGLITGALGDESAWLNKHSDRSYSNPYEPTMPDIPMVHLN